MKRKRMKSIRKRLAIVLGAFLLCGLMGCTHTSEDVQSPADSEKTVQAGDALDSSTGWLNVDSYVKGILDIRQSIPECRESYAQEIGKVTTTEYRNISFADCEFAHFPECEKVSVLKNTPYLFTTQESWDYVEHWLESIGKLDEVDMEKEVRVYTSEVEWDESQEFPYMYPALAEHMDLSNANGTLISNHDYHLVLWYSMNDGKMNEYLGKDESAEGGALGDYSEDVVEEGAVSTMKDVSYPLIDSTLTVGEGAELVKKYFETEAPAEPAEGVEVDVPWVQIFRLGDVYGYAYTVRRIYEGIPFSYSESNLTVQFSGIYYPCEDIKAAYVVDDTGVSAFHGYNDAAVLTPLYSDTDIISMGQAVELLSDNLAGGLDVEISKTGLEYMVYITEEDDTAIAFPCWMFYGVNHVKGEDIKISVDALTGYIYFYTMPDESEETQGEG